MKIYFQVLLSLTLFFSNSLAEIKNEHSETQINCGCKENMILNEVINCDTFLFDNGSLLYRQFNCDSSWLTFENKNGFKRILTSLDSPMIEYTERLGYQFIKEFRTSLLFENRQASGGGFPINLALLNKDNGELLEDFGPIINYNDNYSNGYILYFSDDSLNIVSYYNLNTEKTFNFPIPRNRISKTIEESSEVCPEFLFDDPIIENNILLFKYKYLILDTPETWGFDCIKIDLDSINK